ncbi:MAG: four helix bundle protein [Candidatus Doudnabacteria bacterium]|jgi:four helix bundle protein
MQYNQFEDIPVWQEARLFVTTIYILIEKSDKLKRDFSLLDQLKRASYSILLNIAEGFERGSNKEFANFLNIAKGSAGEVRAIFYILFDNHYIDQETFKKCRTNIIEISSHLANFRKFLLKTPGYKK